MGKAGQLCNTFSYKPSHQHSCPLPPAFCLARRAVNYRTLLSKVGCEFHAGIGLTPNKFSNLNEMQLDAHQEVLDEILNFLFCGAFHVET